MSRKLLIAGNWKMNTDLSSAQSLAADIRRLVSSVRDRDVVVCPPYVCLERVAQRLEGSEVGLGAQEMHAEESGAFTGAINAEMLKSVGCRYVLIGHSERRALFGETLPGTSAKVEVALKQQLIPILCLGETLDEREAGKTLEVVGAQLEAGLSTVSVADLEGVVIAYEPVWAIGTGKVASPAQAQEVHAAIRERLRARDASVANKIRILYGGSVKASNASALLSLPDVDGALVGGASLDAESFADIVKAKLQ